MKLVTCTLIILLQLLGTSLQHKKYTTKDLNGYRDRVKRMFYHAYEGYLKYAYPYDELRPLTCDGHDTWGSYSLTLVDALDTLAIMGNYTEFQRVANLLIRTLEFNEDINVSVFETNIRIVGGLLSAHLMSRRAGMELEAGWPCSGPLLRMAEDVARKLLPAFNTSTGMPYGTVNFQDGVPRGETTVTCTAGVGTFIVEFGALTRLTGDPVFEQVAMKAVHALWNARSELGLLGNHIDVATGRWTALDSGIGAGVDSYFEYLVKGAVMFEYPELMEMFYGFQGPIEKYLKREDWYMWANMKKGQVTMPVFQSLECFYPGILSMIGQIEKGMKTLHNYHQVWKQFGFTPEFYSIPKAETLNGREGYPLRPELIESIMYLYQATKDPVLVEMGADILNSIEHSTKTKCGYATVKDVRTHRLDNRMESFFLAETTKYLYLLFDTENFIHDDGSRGEIIQTPNGECIIETGSYIFNTEAHPVDTAALYCCSAQKKDHDRILQSFHDNIDLLSVLDLADPVEDIFGKTAKGPFKKFQKMDNRMDHEFSDVLMTKDPKDAQETMNVSPSYDETDDSANRPTMEPGIPDGKTNTADAEIQEKQPEVPTNPETPESFTGPNEPISTQDEEDVNEKNASGQKNKLKSLPEKLLGMVQEKMAAKAKQKEQEAEILEMSKDLVQGIFDAVLDNVQIDQLKVMNTVVQKNGEDENEENLDIYESVKQMVMTDVAQESSTKDDNEDLRTAQGPYIPEGSDSDRELYKSGREDPQVEINPSGDDNKTEKDHDDDDVCNPDDREYEEALTASHDEYYMYNDKSAGYSLSTCPALPFHQRLSLMGEMFPDEPER